jgi:uncharacterized protein YsxB (DUF464 family)
MITITIERSQAGTIRRFTVSGHAGYEDPGKDIVCAGISAVTVGAVNAVEKLTGLIPRAEMRNGWLSAEAPKGEDAALVGQSQLLLEGMVASLETIADEYGKYVQIKEIIK